MGKDSEMNAYELADELDRVLQVAGCDNRVPRMLRQQADRIAELEKTPTKYCPSEHNEAYEKGFIDGMAKQRESSVDRFINSNNGIIGKIGDSPIHDLVHRSTPQIKELSDEEINKTYLELANSKWGWQIDFARAILKKASEK